MAESLGGIVVEEVKGEELMGPRPWQDRRLLAKGSFILRSHNLGVPLRVL